MRDKYDNTQDTPIEPAASTAEARTPIGYALLVLRGFLMGSADVVPGVSGGTMALILGIYEELIDSIKSIASKDVIGDLVKFRLFAAFKRVNGFFLMAVGIGILLAIFSLASLLEGLLADYPVFVWAFFFGLVVSSAILVSKRIPKWEPIHYGVLVVAAIATFFIVGLVPAQTPDTWWFFFISGALAICAMILPGISGAFILVLLGKYQSVLGAVSDFDIATIALVGAGAFIGLISFAQVISWLFKRYHDVTIALLTGLLVGSLRKLWPWKEVLETMVDRHGEVVPIVEQNILPMIDANFALAIGLALLGFGLVLFIEWQANRLDVEDAELVEE